MIITTPSSDFSPLLVSTTTVIGSVGCPVNILDVAKYLPLDKTIIGIKLVYARGSSSIMRGVAQAPKERKKKEKEGGFYKDFYNQVTCTICLPRREGERVTLVSCKVFHNGTLHITGSHHKEEAIASANLLLERLALVRGAKLVGLVPQCPFMRSYDNVVYATDGTAIGWANSEVIHIHSEYVRVNTVVSIDGLGRLLKGEDEDDHGLCNLPVFLSDKWHSSEKRIYTLNGVKIGNLRLVFQKEVFRRNFEVKFGYIYSGNRIIGREMVYLDNPNEARSTLLREDVERRYLKDKGVVPHLYSALPEHTAGQVTLKEESFQVHMINTFFQAPFRTNRDRLHSCFLANGYYSRLEPCDNAAVNLRFHYNEATYRDPNQRGKCRSQNKQACTCKDISVSCFNSGKMNVAGLSTMEQGRIVYEFMRDFYTSNRAEIEARSA